MREDFKSGFVTLIGSNRSSRKVNINEFIDRTKDRDYIE